MYIGPLKQWIITKLKKPKIRKLLKEWEKSKYFFILLKILDKILEKIPNKQQVKKKIFFFLLRVLNFLDALAIYLVYIPTLLMFVDFFANPTHSKFMLLIGYPLGTSFYFFLLCRFNWFLLDVYAARSHVIHWYVRYIRLPILMKIILNILYWGHYYIMYAVFTGKLPDCYLMFWILISMCFFSFYTEIKHGDEDRQMRRY